MSKESEEIFYQIPHDERVVEISKSKLDEIITSLSQERLQNEEYNSQMTISELDLRCKIFEDKLKELNNQVKVYIRITHDLMKDLKKDKFAQPKRNSTMSNDTSFQKHDTTAEIITISSSDDERAVPKNKTDESINAKFTKSKKKRVHTQIETADNVKPATKSDDVNVIDASPENKKPKVNVCKPCPKSKIIPELVILLSDDELDVPKDKTDESINAKLVKRKRKNTSTQIEVDDSVKPVVKSLGFDLVEAYDEANPIDFNNKNNPGKASDNVDLIGMSAEVKESKINVCKPCPKSKKNKFSIKLNNNKKQKHSLNLSSVTGFVDRTDLAIDSDYEPKDSSLASNIVSETYVHKPIQMPVLDEITSTKEYFQLVSVHGSDSKLFGTNIYTAPTALETKKKYPPPFSSVVCDSRLLAENSPSEFALNLLIKSQDTNVTLIWDMERPSTNITTIKMYELFVCQETDLEPDPSMWQLVSQIKALSLPMRCHLDMFEKGFTYHFAVRIVDKYDRRGHFSIDNVTIL